MLQVQLMEHACAELKYVNRSLPEKARKSNARAVSGWLAMTGARAPVAPYGHVSEHEPPIAVASVLQSRQGLHVLVTASQK